MEASNHVPEASKHVLTVMEEMCLAAVHNGFQTRVPRRGLTVSISNQAEL